MSMIGGNGTIGSIARAWCECLKIALDLTASAILTYRCLLVALFQRVLA